MCAISKSLPDNLGQLIYRICVSDFSKLLFSYTLLFKSGLNPNLRLNWLNLRINFNRRFVVLFKHQLAQTLG